MDDILIASPDNPFIPAALCWTSWRPTINNILFNTEIQGQLQSCVTGSKALHELEVYVNVLVVWASVGLLDKHLCTCVAFTSGILSRQNSTWMSKSFHHCSLVRVLRSGFEMWHVI